MLNAARHAGDAQVFAEVAEDDAPRYGIVEVGEGGRVTDYAYKPDEPRTTTATNGTIPAPTSTAVRQATRAPAERPPTISGWPSWPRRSMRC